MCVWMYGSLAKTVWMMKSGWEMSARSSNWIAHLCGAHVLASNNNYNNNINTHTHTEINKHKRDFTSIKFLP